MSRYERNKKKKLSKAIHDEILNLTDTTNSPDSTNRPDLNLHVLEFNSDSEDDLFLQLRSSHKKTQASFLASINAPDVPSFDPTSATSGPSLLAASSAAFLDAGK